jgi:protein tyrosine phosphatase (PTP) superfamily phosphohydrolase (DUF442 family)
MRRHVLPIAILLAGWAVFSAALPAEDEPDRIAQQPHLIDLDGVPNACRIHAKLICGGQPDPASGFEALYRLGVRTIISVDGAKPNVTGAKQAGLRYVHLPHGYDGIPNRRRHELAKAVRDLPGLVYIHCHHGKHRSPAAAAVAAVGADLITTENAQAVLSLAGTSRDYRGLWQSVAEATPLPQLDQLVVQWQESVDVPPLASRMVQLEQSLDRLSKIEAAGWQAPQQHPDLSPEHEALMMREQLSELLRPDTLPDRPARFRRILEHSRESARLLQKQLGVVGDAPSQPQRLGLSKTLAALRDDCIRCHRQYRD